MADTWVAQVEAIQTVPAAQPGVEYGAAAKPDAGTSPSATATAVRVLPLGNAVLPTSPSSPNTKLNLALGTLIGLALGMAYAVIRRHLDRRIRQAAEIERLFGVPAIGTLPADRRLDGRGSVPDTGTAEQIHDAGGAMAEALRELGTNLSFLDVDQPPRIIVVTSSVQAEGKSRLPPTSPSPWQRPMRTWWWWTATSACPRWWTF